MLMGEGKRNQKIYTTHCHPNKRPRFIGQPAIINGKRAIAYVKDDEIESYILWDEANEQVFKDGVPEMKVEF